MTKCSYFDGLRATVHEIAQEQEVGFRRSSGHVEQPEQIAELAVQVANHFDGCLQPQQHGLSEESAPSVHAQGPYARFGTKAAGGAKQTVYNVVVGTALSRHTYCHILCICSSVILYYCLFGVSTKARRHNKYYNIWVTRRPTVEL